MARIRTIKPEIWLSAQFMNLCHSARLLFIGLISYADDEGRGSADTRRLRAAVFGGDDFQGSHVDAWLGEIVAQRLVLLYDTAEHGRLYQLTGWRGNQRIEKPQPSHYPAPLFQERSGNVPGTVVERSRGIEGSKDLSKDLTRARVREAARREEDGTTLGAAAEEWLKGNA